MSTITSKTFGVCSPNSFGNMGHMFKQTRAASCISGDGCVEQKFGLVNVGWKSDSLQHPLFIYYLSFSWDMCHRIVQTPATV